MAQMENSPLLKQLASSDPTLRTEALHSLRTFLTRDAPFLPADLRKIQKYLFYAVYMSDGPHAQQALCRDIASLIAPLPGDTTQAPTLARPNVLPFVATFWASLAREWRGLDRLRMDKYLLLARLVLRAALADMAGQGWAAAAVDAHLAVLAAGPLSRVEDGAMPRGLTFHVLDCWTDEIETVAGDALGEDEARARVPLRRLWEAVHGLEGKGLAKALRKRAGECCGDERWRAWGVVEDEVESEEEEWNGLDE